MDPFDEASEAFLEWLGKSGAEISSKIALKDLRNIQAGRSVGKLLRIVALRRLPPVSHFVTGT